MDCEQYKTKNRDTVYDYVSKDFIEKVSGIAIQIDARTAVAYFNSSITTEGNLDTMERSAEPRAESSPISAIS